MTDADRYAAYVALTRTSEVRYAVTQPGKGDREALKTHYARAWLAHRLEDWNATDAVGSVRRLRLLRRA